MKQSFNIIIFAVSSNISTYATDNLYDGIKIPENFNIFDGRLYIEDHVSDSYTYSNVSSNNEEKNNTIEKNENTVPIKKTYMPVFKKKQYFDPEDKGYVDPKDSKYKVYVIDTNPRWKNIKLDSESSNSDSDDSNDRSSSSNMRKNKIKIPNYKKIKVIEEEKIIVIHREYFQELMWILLPNLQN